MLACTSATKKQQSCHWELQERILSFFSHALGSCEVQKRLYYSKFKVICYEENKKIILGIKVILLNLLNEGCSCLHTSACVWPVRSHFHKPNPNVLLHPVLLSQTIQITNHVAVSQSWSILYIDILVGIFPYGTTAFQRLQHNCWCGFTLLVRLSKHPNTRGSYMCFYGFQGNSHQQ